MLSRLGRGGVLEVYPEDCICDEKQEEKDAEVDNKSLRAYC